MEVEMKQETNMKRLLAALTAVGCGIYLSKECYDWWRRRGKEWEKERKGSNGYMRHPAYDRYPDLSIHNNLMARYLTPDVYEALKDKVTQGGFTLDKVIQIGVRCPGMPWERVSGVIAGDEDSYHVFALLFDQIINDLHQYGPDRSHFRNMDSSQIIKGKIESKKMKSVRIRAHRSLKGFRLPAGCSGQDRRQIEYVTKTALFRLQDEFKGEYFSISELSESYKTRLATRLLLPDPTEPAITCSDRARDWPEARGIYLSHDKSFTVIVNEADHLQVVLLSKDKELATVFEKFTRGLSALEDELSKNGEKFAWDDHLGYMTSDPANLGTGLQVLVRLRLRRLSSDNRLHFIIKKLKLKRTRKGVYRTNTSMICADRTRVDFAEPNIFERAADIAGCIPSIDIHKGDIYVSPMKTVGVTEVEMINTLVIGISTLIQFENLLEHGDDIDRYIYTGPGNGQVTLDALE